ncbi:Cupredoxin [Trichophaea hybrida]|nr:Cupredoxin [Trichophaea hybrida]
MTHVVQVGDANGSLRFYPAELKGVKAGDMVQFHFWPKSHSVAQSSFDNPCQPLKGNNGVQGFWSGMMPVTPESKVMPIFSILVNDTNPIWYYCATGRHCQSGMTGVINPPEGKTLKQYQAAAANVPTTGIPAEGVTGGNNGTESQTNSTVPAGTSQPTSTSTSPGKTGGATAGAAAAVRIPGQALGALVAAAVGALALI